MGSMAWEAALMATGFSEKTAVGMPWLDCALLRVGMLECLPAMTAAVTVFGPEVRPAFGPQVRLRGTSRGMSRLLETSTLETSVSSRTSFCKTQTVPRILMSLTLRQLSQAT